MLNPSDDFLVQKVILLMTGVPGTVAMRDEISQLIEDGDLSKVSAYIEDFMAQSPTAPGKDAGLAVAVQFVLNSGFSIDLTIKKINQLIADSFRQGIDDSWPGLFSFMINGVGGSVGRILDNRAEAAEVFTNLVDERAVDVNVNDPLVQKWIDKINASDESLVMAKNTANDLIDQLTKPPVLIESAPSDDSVEIEINQDIDLAFNKAVVAGSGNIIIRSNDGEDTRTIAVTDSSQVTIAGGKVSINPTADLHANKSYSIQMAIGVITDSAGRPFAGISDDTTLNFNTIDTIAPALISSAPIDNATAVLIDQEISLVFSESILAGTGDIIISSDDNSDIRTIAVTDSSQVTIKDNRVTINPTADLHANTSYRIQLTSGVITDLAGNTFAGINDTTALNFSTIDTIAPALISSAPIDNATAVLIDQDVSLVFSEAILAGAGDIIIQGDDGDTRIIAVTDSSQVTITGNTLILNPTADLHGNTSYNIQLASGVITDLAGNAYAGISDATTLNFNTINTIPALIKSNPLDDATAVLIDQNISLVFSEAIRAGAGDIIIQGDDGDTRIIAVTDSSQVTITGDTMILNPEADLRANTSYNIQLASGVITDWTGNAYAGISDATTLNFNTIDTIPALITSNPLDDATAVLTDQNISLVFSEAILAGSGDIIIQGDDGDTRIIAVTDSSQVTIAGDTLILNPSTDLHANMGYNIQLASGVITDLAGNAYAGISDTTTLNFTTADIILPPIPPTIIDDHLINTVIANNQSLPSVTGLQDGGFVVTWGSSDQDGSGKGIYGRRYDASGAAQGMEFQINTYTFGDQANPSVTDLMDGGFVVTWTSYDSGNQGIYGQRYDARGAALGTEFVINTSTSGDQANPSVTALIDGGFVVTWDSDHSGDEGIYGQRYDANGDELGAEFQINSFTGAQFGSSVTALIDGGFVVTWQMSFSDTLSYGIYGRRYDASGAALGTESVINTFTTDDQANPSVTALTDGGFVVTWESWNQDGSNMGIYGQRYDANGDELGAEFQVNTFTTDDQFGSSVTALIDGGFVVSWSSPQDGSGYGVFGKRYNANGDEVEWIISGSTIFLTTNRDTKTGTASSDLIIGEVDSDTGSDTLQSSDFIDGGGGDDIAQFELSGRSIPAPTIKSVELIDIRTRGVTGGASLDMSNIDGLKTILVQDRDGGGDTLSLNNVNNIVQLSIANTNSSVILNYKDFIFSSTADGSMALNLTDMNGAVTINNSIDILRELNIWTGGGSNTLTLDGSALGSYLYIHDYFISTGIVSDLNLSILGPGGPRWIDARGTVGDHVLDLKNSTSDLEVFGGRGNETITNGIGSDYVTGGDGDDTIWGAISTATDDQGDVLHGDGGNDIIGGSYGDDRVSGNDGSDSLFGDEGNDFVYGGDGNDIVRGDWGWGSDAVGMDSLFGDSGVDQITGGGGADTFGFYFGDSGITNDTIDVITDFVSGEDIITLFNPTGSGGFFNAGASVSTNFTSALSNASALMADGVGDYIFASDTINGWLFINMESASGVDMAIQLSGVIAMAATDIAVTIT